MSKKKTSTLADLKAILNLERQKLLEDLEIQHTKELEECIEYTRKELLDRIEERMPEKAPGIANMLDLHTAKSYGYNKAIDEVLAILKEERER